MILGDYSLSRLANQSIIALDKGSVEAEEKPWLRGDINSPVPVVDSAAKIGKCRVPSKWLSRG